MILCARVSWPVPAVRVYFDPFWTKDDIWTCSRCGARVKVVA
jgi:hypothetical protein